MVASLPPVPEDEPWGWVWESVWKAAAARRRADAEGVGVALDWEPKEAIFNQVFGVDSTEGRGSGGTCGEVGRVSWRGFGGFSRQFMVY